MKNKCIAKWVPKRPVEVVFCDMALPADKSLAALFMWIDKKLAKRFIWTLKFVGEIKREVVLKTVREGMIQRNIQFAIRHLVNHGNEVVVIGSIE